MEEIISRSRFIRLGTALGVGAAGASVLAACGGGGSGNGGGNGYGGGGGEKKESGGEDEKKESGGEDEKEKQGSEEEVIARTSEVDRGSATTFRDSGRPAVLVHLQSGDFVAYSAVCTHQACTVAYRNGELACPCHGSVFDPANNGQVISPPAEEPLPQIPVEVRGGEVVRA